MQANNFFTKVEPPPEQTPRKVKLSKSEKKSLAAQNLLDLRKRLLREQLQRELKYTKTSLLRGQEDWENLCKGIKLKELHQELDEWKQKTNRILDRKDYHIKLLIENLDTAEEQHERNFSKHCDIIEFLIKFCHHMSSCLESLYESEAQELITDFYNECTNRDDYQNEIQGYYENLMHADNMVYELTVKDDENYHIDKKEDIINTKIKECYDYRDSAVRKMNELCQQLESVFRSLEEDKISARPKDEFDNLMNRQVFHESELIKNKQIAAEGIVIIWELQEKLNKEIQSCRYKEMEVLQERHLKHLNFLQLRASIRWNNKITDSQLKDLASESFNAVELLQKQANYVELMIGLALCCRKSQTEREKVLPWGKELARPAPVKKQDAYDEVVSTMTSRSLIFKCDDDSTFDQMSKLENFLYRSGGAQAQVLMLKEEKKALEKENKQYCEMIKHCYESLTYQKIMKSVDDSELLSALNIERREIIP